MKHLFLPQLFLLLQAALLASSLRAGSSPGSAVELFGLGEQRQKVRGHGTSFLAQKIARQVRQEPADGGDVAPTDDKTSMYLTDKEIERRENEINEDYAATKALLRNRSDDYVNTDSQMHRTAKTLTHNTTQLNVTVERNIDDLASAVGVAEDQYDQLRDDIHAQAHANHSDTLMTARGALRHHQTAYDTPEMQEVMKLEDKLGSLKRRGDEIFDRWLTSDVTHTPTEQPPPLESLGIGGEGAAEEAG